MNPEDDNLLGRIRRLRRLKGLSQHELAVVSGVSLPTIKDIERGAIEFPRGSTLRKLAGALETDVAYLLEGGKGVDTTAKSG